MNSKGKAVVGLLGASGNLGSSFLREFNCSTATSTVSIKSIGRPNKLSEDFNITEKGIIQSGNGAFPDVIINLSNSYIPSPSQAQKLEMELAILGVADAISKTVKQSGCSVISASTYFQYCPFDIQPWSHYAELKTKAKEIIEGAADFSGTNFTDFVLYDNYGGVNRNKFVDLLEQSLLYGSRVNCTGGEQVLNLTHVSDLVAAFISEVEQVVNFEGVGSQTYELKSTFTVNLRELVLIAERASGRHAFIDWGVIPYRDREVFELWETGLNSPSNWMPKIDFESYIKGKFSRVLMEGNK